MKWSIFPNILIKFTPKKFYEIDPRTINILPSSWQLQKWQHILEHQSIRLLEASFSLPEASFMMFIVQMSLMIVTYATKVLVSSKPSNPNPIWTGKAGACSERLDRLARDKQSSLFDQSVNDKQNRLIGLAPAPIDPWFPGPGSCFLCGCTRRH